MKSIKRYFSLLLLIFSTSAIAEGSLQVLNLFDDFGLRGQDDILDVDDAYQITTENTPNSFIVRWIIAEGHYLYRDKMQIIVNDEAVKTGSLQLPPGEAKDDPIFNKRLFVYHYNTEIILPFSYTANGDRNTTFKVKYQGCSEISGICYPPQTREFTVKLSPVSSASAATLEVDAATNTGSELVSEQDQMSNALRTGNIWLTLLAFFIAGLLLAFTPCVFPMVPILCGIIVGQGKEITVRKSFGLSVVYVLAMAATYTIVGILVGLSGENIQAWFQDPWIIGTFALIFVALAFSMFGFYDLQMPASIQNKLTKLSNSQQGGTLIGVAIMGFLSALIVGPCVTAPLVGALIYIADTGDAVLGGMALFSLSMGMGAPLLVIGASAGKVLPKAGAWMDAVKAIFGVLLLALAIWLLERVAPAAATIALWASLIIVSAIYMGAIDALPHDEQGRVSGWRKLWKGLGLLMLIYGIILVISLASGGRDLFHPLKGIYVSSGTTDAQQISHLAFRPIKGIEGLNAALADAKTQGRPVMLDFYADWCISCKEMEVFTFSDPTVQAALSNVILLQADVTPNDEKDKALYKRFGIIGPPSIMFFDRNGNERKNYRVVGFMSAEKFSQHVTRAFN